MTPVRRAIEFGVVLVAALAMVSYQVSQSWRLTIILNSFRRTDRRGSALAA